MIIALEDLYTDNKGICFRHRTEPERLTIYTKEDMPEAVRHLKHFFRFDRDNYFSSKMTEKARTARGTACIAATGDVAPIMKECFTDVKKQVRCELLEARPTSMGDVRRNKPCLH